MARGTSRPRCYHGPRNTAKNIVETTVDGLLLLPRLLVKDILVIIPKEFLDRCFCFIDEVSRPCHSLHSGEILQDRQSPGAAALRHGRRCRSCVHPGRGSIQSDIERVGGRKKQPPSRARNSSGLAKVGSQKKNIYIL